MGSSTSKTAGTTTSAIPTTQIQQQNDLPPTQPFGEMSNEQFLLFSEQLPLTHCKSIYERYQGATEHVLDYETVYKICSLYHMDLPFYKCLREQEGVELSEIENTVNSHMGEFDTYNTFGSMGVCARDSIKNIRLLSVRKEELKEFPALIDETYVNVVRQMNNGQSAAASSTCANYAAEYERFRNLNLEGNVLHEMYLKQRVEKCELAQRWAAPIQQCLQSSTDRTFSDCVNDQTVLANSAVLDQ